MADYRGGSFDFYRAPKSLIFCKVFEFKSLQLKYQLLVNPPTSPILPILTKEFLTPSPIAILSLLFILPILTSQTIMKANQGKIG